MKKHFKQARLQQLANGEAFDMLTAVEDAFYNVPAATIDACIGHSDALLRDMNK